MGHPCGYFLGTSFSKICNFNREFKTKSFRGRISIICRSSVAAIYQNKPLSPVSFFNCRNGLFAVNLPWQFFDIVISFKMAALIDFEVVTNQKSYKFLLAIML